MDIDSLKRFDSFLSDILIPAADEFSRKLGRDEVRLHDAFSMSYFIAHTLDHITACSQRIRLVGNGRPDRVKVFDELFSVAGGRFQNMKFRLVDAVNNSLKHVELTHKHYKELKTLYGLSDFQVLKENDGRVMYERSGYRFDYGRVVLRPIIEEVTATYSLEDAPERCELAYGFIKHIDLAISSRGNIRQVPYAIDTPYDESDPSTAIDRIIDRCNPVCLDCGEGESECHCDTFVYGESTGKFAANYDEIFDFDLVLSQISGAES